MLKKSKQIGVRLTGEEWDRLVAVQENIAVMSRGQKPDISDIIRSLIGFGNPTLVSEEERQYLAGKGPLHGPHGSKRNKT